MIILLISIFFNLLFFLLFIFYRQKYFKTKLELLLLNEEYQGRKINSKEIDFISDEIKNNYFDKLNTNTSNKNIIYCVWMDDDKMSKVRFNCLKQLVKTSKSNVKIITDKNINSYIFYSLF